MGNDDKTRENIFDEKKEEKERLLRKYIENSRKIFTRASFNSLDYQKTTSFVKKRFLFIIFLPDLMLLDRLQQSIKKDLMVRQVLQVQLRRVEVENKMTNEGREKG